MRVVLKQGESLIVCIDDSDGEFEIHYNTPEHPDSLIVKETAGLPGSLKGEAFEILYDEKFGLGIDDVAVEKAPESGPELISRPAGKTHHQ
jgi:hypothetical protein